MMSLHGYEDYSNRRHERREEKEPAEVALLLTDIGAEHGQEKPDNYEDVD
jgi:hypothetical protein